MRCRHAYGTLPAKVQFSVTKLRPSASSRDRTARTATMRGSGGPAHPRLLEALALMGVEMELAQPNRFGRPLDELVVLNPGQGPLERHAHRRRQLDRLVLACGADIG